MALERERLSHVHPHPLLLQAKREHRVLGRLHATDVQVAAQKSGPLERKWDAAAAADTDEWE